MSHLSVRQIFLLALARADQDRACRREAGKRSRDSEEGGFDASVVGHSVDTHLSATAGVVTESCCGDGHDSPSLVTTATRSASSASKSRADEATIDESAYGGAVRVAGGAVPDATGADFVLHPQGGSGTSCTALPQFPSDGGLHFHLHVEDGGGPTLVAGWQARGASPELAAFLRKVLR